MGQIVGGAAKPKRCNLNKLSQLGTPAAGEHILVSSDNSMNAAGQGNFDCYIEGDGQKAATALELHFIDDKLTEEVSQLGQEVNGKAELTSLLVSGQYYSTRTIGAVPTQGSNASWRSCIIPIVKGEQYKVVGQGGDSPRLWAFAGSDNKVTSYCAISGRVITENITAPEDGYLYVNLYTVHAGDGVWRTSGGHELEINLLKSAATSLDARLEIVSESVGLYDYEFSANSVEHSSTLDKFAISYVAGTTIKGTLSQGTAVCNGASVSVSLYNGNTQVAIKAITIGTEFTISAKSNATHISFYIYRVTTYGTFKVSLKYLTVEDAFGAIDDFYDLYFSGLRRSFDFSNATIGSTYVGKSISDLSIEQGESFTIYISGNDNNTNQTYFNFYNASNARIASGIGAGNGKRVINLTNTFGATITKIECGVVKIFVQAIYDIVLFQGGGRDIALELDLLKDDLTWLPDYLYVPHYYDNQLATKTASIRTAMLDADKNGSTFVFLTDVHWPNNTQHSPALINYLLHNLPINDVFFGGDIFNGGNTDTQVGYLEDFGKKMHQAAPRFFPIFGNHDSNLNDGGTGFNGDYFYSLLLKYADYQVVPGDYDNYYFDNETTKTRFIVLNTGQSGDYQTAAQTTWLNSTLSAMGAGYHAIIFLHIAYLTATALTNGTMAPTMAAAAAAADTFNAQADGRKVEAFICGHLHDDANKVTDGGIPIILTDCDTRQSSSGNPQAIGTVNEQAFDVITINYSGTITCVRIGRGSDRTITY